MTTGAVALPLPNANGEVRPAVVAWSVALAVALVLLGAGVMGSTPPVVLAFASAFLFVAVASDVRSHRVPNLLTLPALLIALGVSPWIGGTTGPLEAAAGVALGFALLIGPYAIGGMGAGDVKALMVLGAWLGPATTLGATAWAVLVAGGFGLLLLLVRGELGDYFRRWARMLVMLVTTRRFGYEAPPRGSSAAGGIPFAVALALGLAAMWSGGFPW